MSRRQILRWLLGAAAAGAARPLRADCPANLTGDGITLTRPASPEKRLGFTARGIENIKRVFRKLQSQDLHPGAQLAVYRHGALAVDLAGGVTRTGGTTAVTSRTLYPLRSAGLTLNTVLMLQAHERKRFAYDDPVAKHWPGFAANGKDGITIAHVLSHRTGLPRGAAERPALLASRGTAGERLAELAPEREPGTYCAFDPALAGLVCGELLERWEQARAAELLRLDLLAPLTLDELHVGIGEALLPQLAPMELSGEVQSRTPSQARLNDFLNSASGAALAQPWATAAGTAVALGRAMCVFAGRGEFEGRGFFRAESLARITQPAGDGGMDEALGVEVRWGLGLMVGAEPNAFATAARPPAIGHYGDGASVAWADPEHGLAVVFLSNRAQRRAAGIRVRALGDAIYEALA